MTVEMSVATGAARRLLIWTRDVVVRHRTALLVLWPLAVVAVAGASLVPQLAPSGGSFLFLPIDKCIHFAAYAGLAFLPQATLLRPDWARLGALSMAAFGVAVEIAQSYVPGREGSVGDAVINALGVVGGIALGMALRTPRGAGAPA